MLLAIVDLASILIVALVFGVYWGPWIALTRSLADFTDEQFLAIVHRMDRNLGTLMTVLLPLALVSLAAVAILAFPTPLAFWLTVAAFVSLVVSLVVTVTIEVPIVTRIRNWAITSMPADWKAQRDRWVSFHLARVIPGAVALGLLAAGAVLPHS
ncbi:MAG TPA: anthrone oxygenase family protein [Galbitalea sp.]|jgi:uncharacterized membrane protein